MRYRSVSSLQHAALWQPRRVFFSRAMCGEYGGRYIIIISNIIIIIIINIIKLQQFKTYVYYTLKKQIGRFTRNLRVTYKFECHTILTKST